MHALKHRDHLYAKKPQTLWLGSSCSGHPYLLDESALILFLIPGFTLARRLPITALQRITLPKAITVITSLSCLTYVLKKSHACTCVVRGRQLMSEFAEVTACLFQI